MTVSWQNRIIGSGEEAPDQLLAHPLNWRIHPKHQQDALAGVLNEVGWVQQVIVNQRTGHLIDGHLRVSLALRKNEPAVPVLYVDLDEAEEALILATLDPLAALATTDAEKLDELLREVSTGDAAVQQMLAEIGIDAEIAAAYQQSDGDGKTDRQMGDTKYQIKPVLYIDEIAVFEDAIKLTGMRNRGEAITVICRAYIDGHKEG